MVLIGLGLRNDWTLDNEHGNSFGVIIFNDHISSLITTVKSGIILKILSIAHHKQIDDLTINKSRYHI